MYCYKNDMWSFFMFKRIFPVLISVCVSLICAADDCSILVKNYNRLNPPRLLSIDQADRALADQRADGSFKSVDYQDKSRGLWKGMHHWDKNVLPLVSAWNKTKNRKYLNGVIAGLNYWGKVLPKNSNWWWQEIGVPRAMIRVINNTKGGIPQETLEILKPAFDRAVLRGTGQNLADAAIIHIWKGVFYRDTKIIKEGTSALVSVLKVSAPGKEGLQYDHCFHQHGPQVQFGNYGKGYFDVATTFIQLLSGTSYAVPAEAEKLIFDYFYHGLRWTLYKDQMDYLACGRQIWRESAYAKYRQIRSIARRFDKKDDMRAKVDDFFKADSVLEGSNYFFRSDYLIHRRKDFYFSYKMCSSRVIGSETINKENLQGLYLGCGVMQYKQTGTEYDNMPALWDWRRLPGLTVVYDNDSLNAARARHKTNRSSAVGAVSDGMNTGIIMNSSSTKLGYWKSVSAIDKTVVFNVSNIYNKTKSPVNTTIDSRLYAFPVKVTAMGAVKEYTGGVHKLTAVTKVVHGNTAYTFFAPQDVVLAIEEKSVPWKSVAVDAKGIQKGKVFTLYVDHGVAAENGDKLSCAVSPADSVPDVVTRFEDCGNIVTDNKSKITYAYFFLPGTMTLPCGAKISCDKKAAVMLAGSKILAADAQQKNRSLKVTLNGKEYNFALPQGGYAGRTAELPR